MSSLNPFLARKYFSSYLGLPQTQKFTCYWQVCMKRYKYMKVNNILKLSWGQPWPCSWLSQSKPVWSLAGVPSPQAMDWFCTMACWKPGCTAGGEHVEQAKFRLYLLPFTRVTAWAPPVSSAVAFDSHRSRNPTVTCVSKGSRSCAPYETPTPNDLRGSWGGDANPGEWLQIQIIMSSLNAMQLNHPETISTPICGKIVFHKPGPWCKKGWGPLVFRTQAWV